MNMEIKKRTYTGSGDYSASWYISIDGVDVGRITKNVYESGGHWSHSVCADGPDYMAEVNVNETQNLSEREKPIASRDSFTRRNKSWGKVKKCDAQRIANDVLPDVIAWLSERLDISIPKSRIR